MFQNKNAVKNTAKVESLDSGEPIFITKEDSKTICDANDVAIAGSNNQNPIGRKLDDIIHIEKGAGPNVTPAYFDREWFSMKQETFLWQGSESVKVRLERRKNIPDFELMESLKSMIGLLLHRIRSSLTGIQGYTELIETNGDLDESTKYIEKIHEGTDELFELLDELNSLQEISLTRVELKNFSANPSDIIRDIINEYPTKLANHITFEAPDHSPALQCNPGELRRILSLLIDNAVEFAPADKHQVTISQPSPHSIKVAHNGNPIPKAISGQLFYPFVTSQAQKLGIGLTMAMLYAKRYDGSIFVTDNNPFQQTSFLFCLPPADQYQYPSLL